MKKYASESLQWHLDRKLEKPLSYRFCGPSDGLRRTKLYLAIRYALLYG